MNSDQVKQLERRLTVVRIVQFLLILSAFATLFYAYIFASRQLDTVISGKPSDIDIKRTILVELPLAAAHQNIDKRLNEALDREDLERARIYYNLVRSAPSDYAVRKETMERFRQHDKKWWRYWVSAKICFKSIFTRDTSTGEGLACNAASDIFVVGDIADLSKQSWNWARGQETDEIIIGLSLFGVGATAISAWTANPVPASGVAAAKTLMKSGKQGNRFAKLMKPLVKNAVDIPLLRKQLGRLTLAETAALMKQPSRFLRPGPSKTLGKVFNRIKVINGRTSYKGTLKILQHVSDLKQLAQAERLTKIFTKNSPAVLQVMGARTFKLMKLAKPAARITKYSYKSAMNFFAGILLLIPILLELVARKFIRPALRNYRKKLEYKLHPEKRPGRAMQLVAFFIPLIAITGLAGTIFLWQHNKNKVADMTDPDQVAIYYLYDDAISNLNNPVIVKALEEKTLPKGKNAAQLKKFLKQNCTPGRSFMFSSTKAECASLLRAVSYNPVAARLVAETEKNNS